MSGGFERVAEMLARSKRFPSEAEILRARRRLLQAQRRELLQPAGGTHEDMIELSDAAKWLRDLVEDQ